MRRVGLTRPRRADTNGASRLGTSSASVTPALPTASLRQAFTSPRTHFAKKRKLTGPSPLFEKHIPRPVLLLILMQLEPHELCSLARVCRKTAEWSRQEELEKVWRQWYAKHFGAVVPSVASHRALYNMRERSAVNGCLNHGRFLMVAGEDAIAAPEDAPTEDELSEIAWGHRSFTFLHPGRVCGVAIPHHTVSSPSGRPSLTAGELAQGWLDMYRRPIPDEDLRRLGPDVVDDLLHRGLQLNYGALLFPKRWFGRLDKSGVTQFTT